MVSSKRGENLKCWFPRMTNRLQKTNGSIGLNYIVECLFFSTRKDFVGPVSWFCISSPPYYTTFVPASMVLYSFPLYDRYPE